MLTSWRFSSPQLFKARMPGLPNLQGADKSDYCMELLAPPAGYVGVRPQEDGARGQGKAERQEGAGAAAEGPAWESGGALPPTCYLLPRAVGRLLPRAPLVPWPPGPISPPVLRTWLESSMYGAFS